MEKGTKSVVVFFCVFLIVFTWGFAKNPPKSTGELIAKYQQLWNDATYHQFLKEVKDGTLPEEAFSTWLGQDYHFAGTLLDSQCLILMRAPRTDQNLLIGGLFALDDELSWFEENAALYNIDLEKPVLPTCQSYKDFLLALQYKPYATMITCVWALERVYFDAWSSALPGDPKYKEFIDRWTTDAFKDYVDALENAANTALATATQEERQITEIFFEWVLKYEVKFWNMALGGE